MAMHRAIKTGFVWHQFVTFPLWAGQSRSVVTYEDLTKHRDEIHASFERYRAFGQLCPHSHQVEDRRNTDPNRWRTSCLHCGESWSKSNPSLRVVHTAGGPVEIEIQSENNNA